MSDINSSLPVRTENPGDVVVKIGDKTLPSQQLTVNADGSVNVTDNGSSLTVDANNLDIRDLTSASDSVSVLQATHDNLNANANLQVGNTDVANGNPVPVSDAGGSLTVDATDLDIRNLLFATDKVDVSGSAITAVVSATDLDIRNLSASQDNVAISDGTDTLAINADGSINSVVTATDLDIRNLSHAQDSIKVGDGTDFLAINTDGSINVVISDLTPGTSVNDYATGAAIAAGADSVHTYTSTGNFNLTQIEASATGKMKVVVQVNGATKFVGFNSTANPNVSFMLSQPALATNTQTIVVTITNKEVSAQDVYSTISGYIAP